MRLLRDLRLLLIIIYETWTFVNGYSWGKKPGFSVLFGDLFMASQRDMSASVRSRSRTSLAVYKSRQKKRFLCKFVTRRQITPLSISATHPALLMSSSCTPSAQKLCAAGGVTPKCAACGNTSVPGRTPTNAHTTRKLQQDISWSGISGIEGGSTLILISDHRHSMK
jgi:hypothetical protein